MCDSCFVQENQIHLREISLRYLSADDVFDMLNSCSQIKPIHVVKHLKHCDFSFYVHFRTKNEAANFFRNFSGGHNHLCCKVASSAVKTAYHYGKDVVPVRYKPISIIIYRNHCICVRKNGIRCNVLVLGRKFPVKPLEIKQSVDDLAVEPAVANSDASTVGAAAVPVAESADAHDDMKKRIQEKKEAIEKLQKELEEEEKMLELAERISNMAINKK